jgi:predicted amidohydrolase YtcJ
MYTLFHNAKIYTLGQHHPICNTILIQKNRIVFCGDKKEINIPDSQLTKINLNGYTILPAFIDCHTHTAMAAKKLDQINLDHCRTFEETLHEIKNNIQRFEKGTWIKGGGWNANLWDGFLPTKNHLDAISTEHPIALYNQDLHTMWLNSLAIQKSGFRNNIPSVLKDKIIVDVNGDLTGIVYEDACQVVEEKTQVISPDNDEQNLLKFSNELLRIGITSVHCMENLDDLELFMKLHRNNKLKTRICFHPPADDVDTFINSKFLSGYGNEWLRIGGLKYFVDGSMGSQTAEMFEKFNELDHAGFEMLTEKDLTKKIKYAANHGLSATVHAIGDKANYKTLNAIEESNNQTLSPIPLRHRIEHSQILADSDIPRFNQLNVIASMQPTHIAFDVKISDKYLGNRAKNAYPINSLIHSGAKVVFGSDLPVADFSPFKGMQAAITRRYNLDVQEPLWYPEQNISILQAVEAYTKHAAFASYEESIKGTLTAGKLADFVILSDDLLDSKNPEELLRTIEVLATVLDGKIEYQNENFDL